MPHHSREFCNLQANGQAKKRWAFPFPRLIWSVCELCGTSVILDTSADSCNMPAPIPRNNTCVSHRHRTEDYHPKLRQKRTFIKHKSPSSRTPRLLRLCNSIRIDFVPLEPNLSTRSVPFCCSSIMIDSNIKKTQNKIFLTCRRV